jgi:uncharacterized membrane protein
MPLTPPHTTRLRKSVTIAAPLPTVFAFWSDIGNFPRFIPLIAAVRPIDGKRSQWIVPAPFGLSAVFESEVVEWIPDRRMVWESRHSLGQGRGCLDFREVGAGTRVDCLVEYQLGPLWLRRLSALMSRLGFPSSAFDEGFLRIKREIEASVSASPRAKEAAPQSRRS